HRGAAGEVQAEVEAVDGDLHDRGDHQQQHEADRDPAPPHEVDAGLGGDEFQREKSHVSSSVSGDQMAIDLSLRLPPYSSVATPRDTVTAVNTEVRMPITIVTAKPRSGPVPKAYRATPASSAVMLESKIVPEALS